MLLCVTSLDAVCLAVSLSSSNKLIGSVASAVLSPQTADGRREGRLLKSSEDVCTISLQCVETERGRQVGFLAL